MEGIEAAITEAEGRKAALEARLADPTLYTRPADEIARATSDFEAATREVDALYARWAELEDIVASAQSQKFSRRAAEARRGLAIPSASPRLFVRLIFKKPPPARCLQR